MAGLGWKQWTRERLASAQVQGYLQDQVVARFASAAARSTARPAPTEGMLSTLDSTDAVYRFDGAVDRLLTPGGVRARGSFARTDGAATLNANSGTDLTCRTDAATVGGGWVEHNGGTYLGYANGLPGRYLIGAGLRTNTGADRWEALLMMIGSAEQALDDAAVLGGFSGLGGMDVVEAPAGISFGFRYITNAGVAGAIRAGSWWSCTYLGPIG